MAYQVQVYDLVKIQDPNGGKQDFVLIAKHEFNPAIHTLFEEKTARKREQVVE